MQFRLKGASGEVTGRTFDLGSDTLIGSADQADVQIESLLERHARIVFENESLRLEAVDQAWINGQPARHQPLQSGDEIRLGTVRFVLQAPGLRPPSVLGQVAPPRSRNTLRWVLAAAAVALAAAVWWLGR